MNHRASLSAVSVIVLALSGCSTHRQEVAGVQQTVARYLDAERDGRYQEAWALLAPTDRAVHPVQAYVQDHERAGIIWQEIARVTLFEIEATRRIEDHWTVDIVATRPDAKAVEQRIKGVSPEAIARSQDPEGLVRAQVRQTLHKRDSIPSIQEPMRLAVTESDDGSYRVWLGLDRQFTAIEYAQRARAAAQRGDAEAERRAWEALLEVPHDPTGVVAMLAQEARDALATRDAAARIVRPEQDEPAVTPEP